MTTPTTPAEILKRGVERINAQRKAAADVAAEIRADRARQAEEKAAVTHGN